MNSSKLLVYLSENNFGEVISKLRVYNPKLEEYELKMTEKNIMIFTFWNIRDIEHKDFDYYNYEMNILFINNMNEIYKFCPAFMTEIPFDYTKSFYIFVTTPVLFLLAKRTSTTISNPPAISQPIIHMANVQPISPLTPVYKKIVSRAMNHDVRPISYSEKLESGGTRHFFGYSTITSNYNSENNITPLGSHFIGPHKNKIDTSDEAPYAYAYSDISPADAKQKFDSKCSIRTTTAKFIKNNSICPVELTGGVCLNNSNEAFFSFEEKAAVESTLSGVLRVKVNSIFNPKKITYGHVHNALRDKQNSRAEEMSEELSKVILGNFYYVRSLTISKYKLQNIPCTEDSLRQDPHYLHACEGVILSNNIVDKTKIHKAKVNQQIIDEQKPLLKRIKKVNENLADIDEN